MTPDPNIRVAVVGSRGRVLNVVVIQDGVEWAPPANTTAIDAPGDVEIGWTYANGVFTPPPPEQVAP